MRDPPVSAGHPIGVGGQAPPPLVAVAHGSRDPRAADTARALLAGVRGLLPDTEVRLSALDHDHPRPDAAIAERAARGAGEVVVLPLLLTAAYHSEVDLPEILGRVQGEYPWLRLRRAATLGPHPLLLDAVEARLAETVLAEGGPAEAVPAEAALAERGAALDSETALVLAAAGSSDPAANATVAEQAAELARRGPWRDVVPAFASMASPAPGEAVARLREAGAARVAVATYLLAPGYFADKVARQAYDAGASAVSAPLGDGAPLAELVRLRYREAITGHHHSGRNSGRDSRQDETLASWRPSQSAMRRTA
jgi:sirohydrochlorin ferrochelatase